MSESQTKPPSRRGFMLGAAAASAATAAAVTLSTQGADPAPVTGAAPAKPEKGGGYRLSEHVKHYYRTTLV